MSFRGFPEAALEFYEGLEADNSKVYWGDHKDIYVDQVRAPLEALVAQLTEEFGPATLFRPHRDVRFSKDKAPYKTNNYGVVRVPGTESGSMSRSRRAACTRAAATGRWRRTSSPAIARP